MGRPSYLSWTLFVHSWAILTSRLRQSRCQNPAGERERSVVLDECKGCFAPCPDCGEKIKLWPLLKEGKELICPYCEADLMVVSLDPVELDWAYTPPAEDDKDWDDWDDDWNDEDEDH